MSTSSTSEEQKAPTKAPKPNGRYGVRHLQMCVVSCGNLLAYTMRVNMSVAIVAMVDGKNANPDFPEYNWDGAKVALVLSSFYWGYVLPQIPAGELSQKYGPKLFLFGALFFASLFAILTPLAAKWGGWTLVCACRALQGICQGFFTPSAQTFLARWSPIEERGTFSTLVYSGVLMGTVIALSLSGSLASSSAGWPSCFYMFGFLSLVWSVCWLLIGAGSPSEHKYISREERDYILDSVETATEYTPSPGTPWKQMLTSLPMWAIVIANVGHNWGFITLLTELPTYMKTVLHFTIESNGALSALPYVVMYLMSFVFSYCSGLLNRKQIISLTSSRKIFNTIGLWGPAIALVVISYATDSDTVVVLLTVAIGLNAGIFLGFNVNYIDVAPNFAGTMAGIGNCAANVTALFAPLVVGAIVTESGSTTQWRTVFFIAAAIYFASNLFYLKYGTAKLQYWNDLQSGTSERSILIPRHTIKQCVQIAPTNTESYQKRTTEKEVK